MSAAGVKTISESPVDSLGDSDQFSIKVKSYFELKACMKWKILSTRTDKISSAALCFLSFREMR